MKVTTRACYVEFFLGADLLDQVNGFGVREGFILILLPVRTVELVTKI